MSNFLRSSAALRLATSTLAFGCGNNEKPNDLGNLGIENMSPQTLVMSDNPDFYDYEHRQGAIDMGRKATARCIVYDREYPKNTQLYVEYGGNKGYISVFTAATKTTRGGELQITPRLKVLQDKLPDCQDTEVATK